MMVAPRARPVATLTATGAWNRRSSSALADLMPGLSHIKVRSGIHWVPVKLVLSVSPESTLAPRGFNIKMQSCSPRRS